MLRRRANLSLQLLLLRLPPTHLFRLLILSPLMPSLSLPSCLLLHRSYTLLPRLCQALTVSLELDPEPIDPRRCHEVRPTDTKDEGEDGAHEGAEGEDEGGYNHAE